MNFFDIIRNIYQKKKEIPEFNNGFAIVINKWLSQDKDNISPLKSILKYMFYIEPEHYYFLLFFNIPKKNRVPFFKNKKEKKVEETELVKKIQYILGWSNRELEHSRSMLEATVLTEPSYWKGQLGL